MIKIECDRNKPPMKVEYCGGWTTLAEEAANIIEGLTVSLLRGLPAEVHRGAADILKEAYALGYREGLKKAERNRDR